LLGVSAHPASRLAQIRPDEARSGQHEHLKCNPRRLPLKTTHRHVGVMAASPGPPELHHCLDRSV